MPKPSRNLEAERAIREYSYVNSDLEYKNSILEENKQGFLSSVNEAMGIEEEKDMEEENRIANEEKANTEKPSWMSFDEDIRTKAKKLYREISKKAHPDKDPSGVYSDLFSEVSVAYENCRLFDLFIFCDRLGIEYEISEKERLMMSFEIEQKKKQIEQIEKSFIYVWSTTSDKRVKDILIKHYIKAIQK